MNFDQSQTCNDSQSTTHPALDDLPNVLPHGPEPTRRWECPARYSTNHKHQDGRPLCRHCECWNPAPFPNDSLPVEPVRPISQRWPAAPLQPTELGGSIFIPERPSLPHERPSTYSSFNLPPMPVPLSNPNLVSDSDSPIAISYLLKDKITYSTLLKQLLFPTNPRNSSSHSSQFPSLKHNSSVVEQTRLPLRIRPKPHIIHSIPKPASNAVNPLSMESLTTYSPTNQSKSSSLDTNTTQISQCLLQVICNPGHVHNNFDSQSPGIRFKHCELIGEKIWRPSHTILDELVQCPNTDTSLQWPHCLRFRVLEERTLWEHWFRLSSTEHSGQKPLIRDCYLTHGWNKQARTPIWLPWLVRNSGTLRAILEQWFTGPKDKVTIIFEYINKDRVRAPTELVVVERFSHLNITL